MFYLIIFTLFAAYTVCHGNNEGEVDHYEISIKDIGQGIVNLLGGDGDENERLKELRDKLQKIDNYVIDRHQFSQLILNQTRQSALNETNFYQALQDQKSLPLAGNVTNLYIQLKSRMNRDDMVKILSEKGAGSLMQSARRMLEPGHSPPRTRDHVFEEIVDELIAELTSDRYIGRPAERQESHYWDPKQELEERRSRSQDGRRIYKGERTHVRAYPFMVSVQVMGRFWCGGVLYWHDLVITSAACLQLMHNNRFFRENPKMLSVRVGSNHSRVSGEVVDALEVYFHPGYEPRTLRNNIAVIRLRRVLKFNYHRVPKIIDISHNDEGISFTTEVLLLGWGVNKKTQKVSFEPIYLQRKLLPIYPNEFCKEVYGDKFITRTMFCAGTMTTGEGACDHDAGGPAILYGKLVGVISFGPTACGYPGAPTVLTLVGAFADWIESVNESIPGYVRSYARTTTTTEFPLFEWHQQQQQQQQTQTPSTKRVISLLDKSALRTSKRPLRPIEKSPIMSTTPDEIGPDMLKLDQLIRQNLKSASSPPQSPPKPAPPSPSVPPKIKAFNDDFNFL